MGGRRISLGFIMIPVEDKQPMIDFLGNFISHLNQVNADACTCIELF